MTREGTDKTKDFVHVKYFIVDKKKESTKKK